MEAQLQREQQIRNLENQNQANLKEEKARTETLRSMLNTSLSKSMDRNQSFN
jgi:hypothetical protein